MCALFALLSNIEGDISEQRAILQQAPDASRVMLIRCARVPGVEDLRRRCSLEQRTATGEGGIELLFSDYEM